MFLKVQRGLLDLEIDPETGLDKTWYLADGRKGWDKSLPVICILIINPNTNK